MKKNNPDTSRSEVRRLKSNMGDVILYGYQADADGEVIDGTVHVTMFTPKRVLKEKDDGT